MSWSSAGATFDQIAASLIKYNASDDCKREVCSALISLLRDGDWDGEGYSLDQFRDDLAIVAAFADHGVELREEEGDG